jgi:hypothetical protein
LPIHNTAVPFLIKDCHCATFSLKNALAQSNAVFTMFRATLKQTFLLGQIDSRFMSALIFQLSCNALVSIFTGS